MKNIELQDLPEFRLRRSQVFSKIVDRYDDIQDDFGTAEQRMDFLDSIDSEGFIKLITVINRILAQNHTPNSDGTFFTEVTNAISDPENPELYHGLPIPRDKAPLLTKLHGVCMNLLDEPDRQIDHIAAVVGNGINAIHPFTDANGRTARAVYEFLTKDPDSWTQALEDVALEDKDNLDRLNPSFLRDGLYTELARQFGTHYEDGDGLKPYLQAGVIKGTNFASTIPKNRDYNPHDSELMYGIVMDFHLGRMLPHRLVTTYDSPAIQKSQASYSGQDVFMLNVFNEEADKYDIIQFRRAYRELVNSYVCLLLDQIAYPDSQSFTIVNTDEKGQMKIGTPELITRLAKNALTLA